MAPVEFQDPPGDVIQKVAIMGHGDNGARIFLEKTFQPCDRFGIEVIGGLIQQQHIGFRQQQAAECDASALTAGQVFYVCRPVWQAQRIGGPFQFAVQLPAVTRVNFVLQLTLFLQEPGHFVVVHGLGKAFADDIESIHQFHRVGDTFCDDLSHGFCRVQIGFLGEVPNSNIGLRAGLTVEVGIDAAHDSKQRRFTGAVQPEYSDLGAWKKAE